MTNRKLLSRYLSVSLLLMVCLVSPVFAAQNEAFIPVEMDYASLVEKVLPSMVRIMTDKASGSGFFVSSNGEILTNYHVIKDARATFVTTHEGFPTVASVKDIDEDLDIVLLVIKTIKRTPFLRICETLPKQGEAVMAAGNPHGLEDTVSNGIVSAFRQNKKWLQFTAPVSQGSSGGALINSRGEVVGMPTKTYKEGQNLNFAISPIVLQEFFTSARTKKVNVPEVPSDPIKLLHVSALQGSAENQYFLAYAYQTGSVTVNKVTIPRNDKWALFWYQRAAEQGHVDAQFQLAQMYYSADEAKRDYPKAAYWYLKAAKQNKPEAQYMIGLMYYFARGLKQDYQQARYWYQKSAEQGYVYAQLNLGAMYHEGEGGSEDYQKSLYWYHKAAEQGNDISQLRLGFMYEDGEGVKRDINQAISWYRKAAKQGNSDAKNILAEFAIYDY